MNEPALAATDLYKAVTLVTGEKLEILRGATLRVAHGTSVAVVGRSGSGKSTLLALLGLLDRPDKGQVSMGGRDTTRMSDAARSRLRSTRLGFVFQNYSLLPHLTVAENVALPFLQGRRAKGTQVRRRVGECLDAVGLGSRGDARPRHLSGGEQQRVAIARALARDPKVVLADEPTGSLDGKTAEAVLGLLIGAVRTSGAALVLVTHDDDVARRADLVVHLRDGRLGSEDGAPCG